VIMNYTREQLIDALVAEWEYLCHDDYDPEDPTPEQFRKDMEELTIEQLIEETDTDDEFFTLDEYMDRYL
jgi:hypothetical protein